MCCRELGHCWILSHKKYSNYLLTREGDGVGFQFLERSLCCCLFDHPNQWLECKEYLFKISRLKFCSICCVGSSSNWRRIAVSTVQKEAINDNNDIHSKICISNTKAYHPNFLLYALHYLVSSETKVRTVAVHCTGS